MLGRLELLAPDWPPGHCVILRKEKETAHLTLEKNLPLCMNMNMQGWSWIHMQTLVLLEILVWCWVTLAELWMLEDLKKALDL